ncbi:MULTISPECIES: hypothetical protein [Halomarina]|uniref:Uncharacterized protein n=2 Tax=Halomarina TaxID=871740 RepID=A0A6B0GGA6_9EURY|nr:MULTISPECIES: hypothetical protein [Halomarina]MWG33734.1 hypothetical protein [Halomarina oriensis]
MELPRRDVDGDGDRRLQNLDVVDPLQEVHHRLSESVEDALFVELRDRSEVGIAVRGDIVAAELRHPSRSLRRAAVFERHERLQFGESAIRVDGVVSSSRVERTEDGVPSESNGLTNLVGGELAGLSLPQV